MHPDPVCLGPSGFKRSVRANITIPLAVYTMGAALDHEFVEPPFHGERVRSALYLLYDIFERDVFTWLPQADDRGRAGPAVCGKEAHRTNA